MKGLGLSEEHDLRGGQPVWIDGPDDILPADLLPAHCDIAIIGAGIMGATLAEQLSADGREVLLLDRRPPAHGSTAASTAEVMWAMDVPLRDLAAQIGEDEAVRRWVRVHESVARYGERIDALGIDCARAERPTLYLAGQLLDEAGLQDECARHRRAGLPTEYLEADAVAKRFGIAPRAGLVSTGGFEVDPVRLTLGLLGLARERGATICHPVDVVALSPQDDGLLLTLSDDRTVAAREVIFAGGYERARIFLPASFSLLSTFVFATPPGVAPLWREGAMIWEASDPYLYIRNAADGRIIIGGEDVDFSDAEQRNALIGAKAGTICAKAEALLDLDQPLTIDRAWAATFGASPDGLPAIGRAATLPHLWLSAGFGGNGIAFAALASEILSAALAGATDPDAICFDPYRFAE